MRILRAGLTAFLVVLIIPACAPTRAPIPTAPNPTFDLGQIVQGTLDAMTAQATPAATATVLSPTISSAPGSISGSLTYPAESLPSMFVVAYAVDSPEHFHVTTQAGQATYKIDKLPPGTYHLIAYTVGGVGYPSGFPGGYTKAVPCGLAAECADHSLIDVVVGPGQHVTGISPSDWYAPAGTFPVFPEGATLATALAATATPPTVTPTP